jgi:serine protease inhibitor
MPQPCRPITAFVLSVLCITPIACQRLEASREGEQAYAAGDAPYERFGRRLFAEIARGRGDTNTILSPLSAGIALALVTGGATGTTYDSLVHVLGAGTLDATALARRDSRLFESLASRKDVTLEVANALWVSPRYTVQKAYVDMGKRSYRSQVSTVPLNTAEGVDKINAWAKDKTHGKIPRILGDPLPDTTALVVTNAVYFHGMWLTEFDIAATKPLDFHGPNGEVQSVPAMERTAPLAYMRDSGIQVVRLPYRGDKVALFVILPDAGVRIEDVESRLALRGLPAKQTGYTTTDVRLRLPRVHAEASIDLLPALKSLGASIAFDCTRADFGAMFVFKENQRACVGSAVQKVFIDIDEKGTTAAAVTAMSMIVHDSTSPPPIQFIVDRPFLFVLRDEVSGVPLFMGRIVSPGTSLKTVQ